MDKTMPRAIFLQHDPEGTGEPFAKASEVTWCAERVYDTDAEYRLVSKRPRRHARLIAAAPGMLAALDAFVQWHADHFEDFAPHDNAQLLCLANDASAAIALARNT